eukprot:349634-Chlamydomonas_euryale.AAC.15
MESSLNNLMCKEGILSPNQDYHAHKTQASEHPVWTANSGHLIGIKKAQWGISSNPNEATLSTGSAGSAASQGGFLVNSCWEHALIVPSNLVHGFNHMW